MLDDARKMIAFLAPENQKGSNKHATSKKKPAIIAGFFVIFLEPCCWIGTFGRCW